MICLITELAFSNRVLLNFLSKYVVIQTFPHPVLRSFRFSEKNLLGGLILSKMYKNNKNNQFVNVSASELPSSRLSNQMVYDNVGLSSRPVKLV